MSKQVEFYFDLGSPTAYLAWTQLPKIAEKAGAEVVWKPMLLGGVFKATDNSPPWAVAARAPYLGRDLQRFAKRYGVPLATNPHFPINTLTLMRGAIALRGEPEQFHQYLRHVFRSMWIEPRNLNDPGEVAKTWQEIGLEPEAFMARIAEPENKKALIDATQEAVSRGVFGAPSFFVGDEMFFGQDRLDFVAEALA